MLSIVSPPPPPIAQLFKVGLSRSLGYALSDSASIGAANPVQLGDTSGITSVLMKLTAVPTLKDAYSTLKNAGAGVIIVTNGSEKSTEAWMQLADVTSLVDKVVSCDSVGLGKPFKQVYDAAHAASQEAARSLSKGGNEDKAQKWFVAAHVWDVCAARKNG